MQLRQCVGESDRETGEPQLDQHFTRLIAIGLGGAVGAVSRYGIVVACVRLMGDRFPVGVLVANVTGCFLLGLLMHEALIADRWLGSAAHVAITVGFLGALTTFSTFGYDTIRLIEKQHHTLAMLNVFSNCALGLVACWLGLVAGKTWWST